VVLAAVALTAAACSSSSKSSSSATTAATGQSPATTAATGSAPGGTTAGAGNTASAPGVTATTIKVGFITSKTGAASSTFSTADTGAKAYFDAINKAGGINGRQIQMVTADDTSSSTGALTATQFLLNQGVFAILVDSAYFFGAFRAAEQAGVPVVGGGFDGQEWGVKPNTNMFSVTGGQNPTHPEVQADIPAAGLFQSLGVTNVGGLAYGISPSSTASIKDLKTAIEGKGLKMGYENLSVPFGTVDVTSSVLAMKSAKIDMAVCSCVQSTVIAMVSGLKQGGVNVKSLSFASADSSLFKDATASQAAQGLYYSSTIPPLDTNNAASNTFQANIKAADPTYQSGTYPSFGTTDAYLSAALFAKGLQVAGQNPTRKSYIDGLTGVTGWNADGLLASPVSFNHFGSSEASYCGYYVHVVGQTFAAVNGGKAFCGAVPAGLK
jgi:branched-chain amino acid transport system substrate-binding protein